MTRIIAALSAALIALGLAAAPAQAGNGTNDFYLSKSCTASNASIFGGLYLKVTDYDKGSGQTYHIAVSRSGVAYSLTGLYVDDRYVNKTLGETYVNKADHGRHTIKIKGTILGEPISCGFTL